MASGFPPVILESIGIFSYISLAIWDRKVFCKKRIVYTPADVTAGMASGICFSFFYNGPHTGFTYPEMGQQQVQTSLYATCQAVQLFPVKKGKANSSIYLVSTSAFKLQ